AAEKLTGWTEFEALGVNIKDVLILREESGLQNIVFPPSPEIFGENFTALLSSRSGSEFPVEVGVQFIGDSPGPGSDYLLVIRDISGQRATEDYMKNLAFLDNLTGLPNRALVYDRIHLALTHSRNAGRFVSFLFLDLDGFKHVNDTLGHDAGDKLLQQTAERLKSVVRDEDTVGRMAGDEFVMILHNVAGEEETVRVAEKIIQQFQKPFVLNGTEIKKTVSVGIALFPRDGSDMESVMKCADEAMYLAKQKGKNAYEVYRPPAKIS
ncbi:MAG: GGDEF domain-containing protein, partial [Spirochaetia bacterium]|nr:GGDEF domain-containing protein [Spirochaetia bacterium]